MRWRFVLDGYEPGEIIPSPFPTAVRLVKGGLARRTWCGCRPASSSAKRRRQAARLLNNAIEVTNRQFKAFVDAGGYQKRE